jgi:hypothetical protein
LAQVPRPLAPLVLPLLLVLVKQHKPD